KAKLVGTVRYLSADVQEQVIREMEKIIKGVGTSNGAAYTFDYVKGYPPLVNHEEEAELVLHAGRKIKEIHTSREVVPIMGVEDFTYYLLDKPGAYFFTGAQKNDQPYPHHHPKFDLNERALPIAAKTLIQVYFDYQNWPPAL